MGATGSRGSGAGGLGLPDRDYSTKTGWYWKNPSEDITDPLKKWAPDRNSISLGLGLTLGTAFDNGHAFAMKALLINKKTGHRIRYLDEALTEISAYSGVWQATAGEIARWYLDHGEAPR